MKVPGGGFWNNCIHTNLQSAEFRGMSLPNPNYVVALRTWRSEVIFQITFI